MAYIIGCDIGTTSVKALAVTISGKILGSAGGDYMMYHPQPDWHEQNPEEIWQATLQCIQQVIQQCASSGTPLGIVFSAAMHSLLVVDEAGMPLTSLMIWADNRSFAQASLLKQNDDATDLYQQTGTPIHPMSPLCKLLWIKDHHPELLDAKNKFVGIKELIMYRLTGQWLTDYSIASATGLFNIHEKQWNAASLKAAGITEKQLPMPVSPLAKIPIIFDLGLKIEEIPLIPGASDGCLSNLGAGALSPGKMALTIGTSAAVRVAVSDPFTATDGSTFCYLLDDCTYISGGGSNSGGKVFNWALNTLFEHTDIQNVTNQIARIAPGSGNLLFMPYLLGERAPLWDASARGGFAGLDITHTRAHMMRAVQEGILFNLYMICNQIEKHSTVTSIYANGGFADNNYWVQMLADIFGKPVIIHESREAAAIGAAIMGFKALGMIQSYEQATEFHTEKARFNPDITHHRTYNQSFESFRQLVWKSIKV